jgi:GNAT superfamily N-acetyltransferase
MPPHRIRLARQARPAELPQLREIEVAAGGVFVDIGMAEIAADEPPSLKDLIAYQRAGHVFVVAEGNDVIAYALVDPVDGSLHVEQISVHPRAARRGIGRDLLDHLAGHARDGGLAALTLTTFVDVPWNAPYYERCGFRRLAGDEITPGLRAIRRREHTLGLDRWPRACMRRDLAA